uniref:Uncharacterized protein n=1 Tax=Spongospora subterranea TaxID=70186 RepID=A0A0H5R7K5_9EUKA|eukprot:CRZ10098.1 hypothetical protein [Spongospora subterranea]
MPALASLVMAAEGDAQITANVEQRQVVDNASEDDAQDDLEHDAPSSKRPRVVISNDTMQQLLPIYRKHYTEFSAGKKKLTQLVPNKVWTKVYADFLNSCGGREPFGEKALKVRLRSLLTSSDPRKTSDEHDSTDSEAEGPVPEERERGSSRQATVLADISKSLEKMSQQVENWLSIQGRYYYCHEQNLHLDQAYKSAKIKNIQLSNLRLLLQTGAITQQEFDEKVKPFLTD